MKVTVVATARLRQKTHPAAIQAIAGIWAWRLMTSVHTMRNR